MDESPASASRPHVDVLDRVLHYTRLPREIAPFERVYLDRTNRLAIRLLIATVAFVASVAWWNGTDVVLALGLSVGILAAAMTAARVLRHPRHVAMSMAAAAMTMGVVLVHAGRGPFEVELHFYFFVQLATVAVYGNPRVVLTAAATVILAHALGWSQTVAAGGDVTEATVALAVHAFFIGLATIGMCFIARVFYDNVFRLERKVEARTGQLDQRQRDVRLLLDNARQAFLVIDADGLITGERSSAIDRWFGPVPARASWFDLLRSVSPDLAERTRAGWQAVVDDFLPVELTLSQLPSVVRIGACTLRVEYRIVSPPTLPLRAMLIVEDVTRAIAEEASRADREEDLQLLAGLLDDRAWMLGFLDEVETFVHDVEEERLGAVEATRALHTLKGNARMTGFGALAALCHEVEEHLAAEARPASPAALAPVAARAGRLVRRARTMMGAAHSPSGGRSIRSRLERLREQARQAAAAAGKEVEVMLDHGDLQLELDGWSPILSNLVHAIQNAIDHGIEATEERLAAGKPRRGLLVVRASESRGNVVLEVEDDGRGPCWADIARRARALGLPTDTPAHLVDAVFQDGLTTAGRVTDTSGRGVGLAALRAATRTLGGTITLRGQAGRGATLRIEVPRTNADRRRRSSASLLRIEPPARAAR